MVVASEPPNRPDWRHEASYAYTRALPRRGWAWEFLKRNRDFQRDWAEASTSVAVERRTDRLTVLIARRELHAMTPWGSFFRRSACTGDRYVCRLLGPSGLPARFAGDGACYRFGVRCDPPAVLRSRLSDHGPAAPRRDAACPAPGWRADSSTCGRGSERLQPGASAD